MSLKIENQEHFDKVVEFAKTTGQFNQLNQQLDHLRVMFDHDNTGRATCHLCYDFAPYSFYWYITMNGETVYNGGLIYHGKHDNGGDGGAPSFSVNLTPMQGWGIHT